MPKVTVTLIDGQIVIAGVGEPLEIVTETPPPPPPPTPPPPPPPPPPPDPDPEPTGYIWVDVKTLPNKPRTGRGWTDMYNFGKGDAPGPVSVSNQDSKNSAWAHACSYIYAATGDTVFLNKTLGVFHTFVSPSLAMGRALALAREVQGYVAAAEGIQLAQVDADLNEAVKAKFKYLLTAKTSGGGPATLLESHQKRPNNWGTHATAAVFMIARYIGDDAIFANAVKVFKGYLGDRSSYAGFEYGDLAWQFRPAAPVGINEEGAIINGLNVDGALPEELRRGSTTVGSTLPGGDAQMYTWEANQGMGAAMLTALNAGVDLRPASNWAHKRNVNFALNIAKWPISGDDAFLAPVLNLLYPDLKLAVPSGSPGKGLAWTEFSHQ